MRAWDSRQTGQPLLTLRLHRDPVLCLALCGEGRRGASGAACAQLAQFSLDLGRGQASGGAVHGAHSAAAPSAQRGVADLAFRAGAGRGAGRLLAAATWDGRVRLFDCAASKPLASMRYHWAAAASVAWDDASGELASGGRDGAVALWMPYPGRGA